MNPDEVLPELNLNWLTEPAGAGLGHRGVEITAGAATDWFHRSRRARYEAQTLSDLRSGA